MWASQATVLFKHINEGLIWRRARKLIIMKIKVGTSSPHVPSSIHERTHHRSSSEAFMSSGPMIRQSALALVIATVAQAYASSSWTICSSSGRARKYFLRPPVRKPTLVWARMTVWAVMPAQVVTPLETMESWDSETKLLDGTDWSYRYDCAGLGISMENTAFSQPVYNRSKSSTACVSARGTSQKIGRKPPRCGISWVTNLPKFQLVPLNVTNSGF